MYSFITLPNGTSVTPHTWPELIKHSKVDPRQKASVQIISGESLTTTDITCSVVLPHKKSLAPLIRLPKPKGIKTIYFKSLILDSLRSISYYHEDKNKIDHIYMFLDGQDYQSLVPSLHIMKRVSCVTKNTLIVFIPTRDRQSRRIEYTCNQHFGRYLTEEIFNLLIKQVGSPLKNTSAPITLIGSSFGGLAAVYHALSYPEIFSSAISLSGSFWYHAHKSKFTDEVSDVISFFNAYQHTIPVALEI